MDAHECCLTAMLMLRLTLCVCGLCRFSCKRLEPVFTYVCQNMLKPRNVRVRDGEPRLHNACCFDIPCAQYAPAPLPRGWKKGDRIPEHHMPSPDDYVFAHSKVWCFDFVDTYGVVLRCTVCAAKRRALEAQCERDGVLPPVVGAGLDGVLPAERLAQLKWTHENGSLGEDATICGAWIIATKLCLYNYATARARVCLDCGHKQHDLQPDVWRQLQMNVLADQPLTIEQLKLNVPVRVSPLLPCIAICGEAAGVILCAASVTQSCQSVRVRGSGGWQSWSSRGGSGWL